MPYTDDNLNELFTRAAEDYPLNTDNSDWNRIAEKVGRPIAAANKKNNNNKKYAALLLLLLLGGSFTIYNFFIKSGSAITQNSDLNKTSGNKNDPASPAIPNSIKPHEPVKVIAGVTQKNSYSLKHYKTANHSKLVDVSLKNSPANNLKDFEFVQADLSAEQLINLSSNADNNAVVTEKKQEIKQQEIIYQTNTTDNQNKLNGNTGKKASKTQKVIKTNQTYKLYGSLFASPEFSTIKFQHINKSGFKAGVSLGYRISNRINIELGLQREKINFYSDGKYFNAENIKLKPETLIENLNGNSKITSVPIALRYNISIKNNHNFFVTGGVNAILITHNEKYNYAVSKAGSEDALSRNYSSVTDPKYFTGINVSAGYEAKLSNWCNFKIEPFYQAPVRNFGIGELPVSSFGINVGIVKNLK